jgi:hypothetical protein
VRSRELQGWAFTGFSGVAAEPRKLTFSLDARKELATAVDTRTRVEVSISTVAAAVPGTARFLAPAPGGVGLAVPVTVGGNVAALLYADDGGEADRMVPASWPETLELIARHASRCLEAQTAIRAAGLAAATASSARLPAGGTKEADSREEEAARRYARLVVSDIRLNNEPAVRAGREAHDLGHRLHDQIERARESYRQRIPAALANRDRLFDEELVRTLADGDPSLIRPSRGVGVS